MTRAPARAGARAPQDAEWRTFDRDGNYLYCADEPDLTDILAVVIEMARSSGSKNIPAPGRGVIELAMKFEFE